MESSFDLGSIGKSVSGFLGQEPRGVSNKEKKAYKTLVCPPLGERGVINLLPTILG